MTWTKSCQVDMTSGLMCNVTKSCLARLAHICNFFENDPILEKMKKKKAP